MAEIQLAEKRLTMPEISGRIIPDLHIPIEKIELGKFGRWILRWVLIPILPNIVHWAERMAMRIAEWVWAVANRFADPLFPDEIPPAIIDAIREVFADLQDDVRNKL